MREGDTLTRSEPTGGQIRTAAMEVHDLGCQCWPHVSEKDALACIVDAVTQEYREGLRRAEAAPSAGLPAEALRILELVREVYSDPPEGDFGLWLTRQIEKHHALAAAPVRPCDCGSEKYRGVHISSCTRTRYSSPTTRLATPEDVT